ncbi:Glycerol 2-dehydrogenase (NADP(+)) [Candida viswanathii]|uniref:2-dehydropantolactone reductase n=1 Tax=Candida viswanathii TaxID=5486 RepID=A0A367YDE7_9ASCO|nr:Glycerol 2-dehydrogenase (NADP(+)) [Candida viswanathii]
MSIPNFKLNDGNTIPALGLGTWQSTPEEVYTAVLEALKIGYRHIDTAAAYENEESIGRAIKDSGVPRSEIYLTTKLWSTFHKDPRKGLDESLRRLGVEYVDLYLIHWPVMLNPLGNHWKFPTLPDGSRDIVHDWDFVRTWEKVQELVGKGAKSVGVSNFDVVNLDKLLAAESTKLVPAVNQVELHPNLPQHKLLAYSKEKGIQLEAYSPLGSTGSPLLLNEVLVKIGEKYGVSSATILISWSIWRGVVVLPKSVTPSRIESNFKVVKLEDEDGKKIDDLYKTIGVKRVINPDWSPVTVFHSDE